MQVLSLIPICALALAACSSGGGTPAGQDDAARRLDLLENRYEALERSRLDAVVRSNHVAFLSVNNEGFSVVDADIGTLTMKLNKVEPSGTGSKAHLTIGNPTSATITELKFAAEWGFHNDDGQPVAGMTRTGDKSIDTAIMPGSWQQVSIMLPDIPPSKLSYLYISKVVAEQIRLLGSAG